MDLPSDLHWFVAVLIFESSIEDAWSDSSVDIQFRLIRAADADQAYERAHYLGQAEESAYENPYGQTCVWSFKGLKDLQEVLDDELADGVEVYGVIEPGTARDHVVEKDQLTAFLRGQIDDEPRDWADDQNLLDGG
jgi:hypothetical protein